MNTYGSAGNKTELELHQRLVALLADVLQIDIRAEIEDVARSEVSAWDSVNHLRLVAEIEEAFDTSLKDEEIITISSLSDIEALLSKRLAAA